MKKRCFKCKGSGKTYHVDALLGVLSFGLTALMDLSSPDECDACDGKGYLEDSE